ncbi:MAG TPA: SDR family oxidoreductase [Phototrophicaceae bacterium]|nr:SDR family oxidoreductase [Phototrophicaceae bacterium]
MSQFNGKTALVTGGSRGIGRGIVEALTAEGVRVWALARNQESLDALKREVNGVQTIAADAADPQAVQVLRDVQPDILVLNAGALPINRPISQQTWETFNHVWDTDVKSTFQFGQEALKMPLRPGSTVIIVSSGAAIGGSPLSGGYAAAKRTQWFLGQYFQQEADMRKLGIRFVVLIPRQMVGTTGVGDLGARTYAAQQGITKEQYLERMGLPLLTPEIIGQGVISLLCDPAYHEGMAYGISGQGLVAQN